MKYICMTFSDKAVFGIPAKVIIEDYACSMAHMDQREGKRYSPKKYREQMQIAPDSELMRWVIESMGWSKVHRSMVMVKMPPFAAYHEEFPNVEFSTMEHEKK